MLAITNEISKQKIIPLIDLLLLDVYEKEYYFSIVKTLYDLNFSCILLGFTHSSNNLLVFLKQLRKKFTNIKIGLHNISSVHQLQQFLPDLDFDYITTPIYDEDLCVFCFNNNIECFSGACTPSEFINCHESGFSDIINFFPANCYGGLNTIEAFSRYYYGDFIVNGGVTLKNIKSYLYNFHVFACIYDIFNEHSYNNDASFYIDIFKELSQIREDSIKYYNDTMGLQPSC